MSTQLRQSHATRTAQPVMGQGREGSERATDVSVEELSHPETAYGFAVQRVTAALNPMLTNSDA
jgi:hypothetical protein